MNEICILYVVRKKKKVKNNTVIIVWFFKVNSCIITVYNFFCYNYNIIKLRSYNSLRIERIIHELDLNCLGVFFIQTVYWQNTRITSELNKTPFSREQIG